MYHDTKTICQQWRNYDKHLCFRENIQFAIILKQSCISWPSACTWNIVRNNFISRWLSAKPNIGNFDCFMYFWSNLICTVDSLELIIISNWCSSPLDNSLSISSRYLEHFPNPLEITRVFLKVHVQGQSLVLHHLTKKASGYKSLILQYLHKTCFILMYYIKRHSHVEMAFNCHMKSKSLTTLRSVIVECLLCIHTEIWM